MAATGLAILLKLDWNHRLISPCDLEIRWMNLKNNKAHLLYYIKLCAAFQSHWHIQIGVTVWKHSIRVKIGDFLSQVTLKIDVWPWKNRAPVLYYVKLCASFQLHWWSQSWVTASNQSSQVKIGDFSSRVTLKIEVWPWKTIGNLSYAASTFVHHFIVNGKFKLELQFGNAPFGPKLTLF